MSNGTFDFNEFIRESKEVLLNPKSYFSTMKITGGMTDPLIKAVIFGAIAGAIAFIWSLLNLGAMGSGMFGGALGIMIFIGKIIGSIIGLFIGAVILLVISSICKGNTDFEANVRVIAAVMVVMPNKRILLVLQFTLIFILVQSLVWLYLYLHYGFFIMVSLRHLKQILRQLK